MSREIVNYNNAQLPQYAIICNSLMHIITANIPEAECKIWHRHPVWFLEGNPIVGYSKLKDGVRLLFWSGMGFNEPDLEPGSGKFKDASILYTDIDQIHNEDVERWLLKSKGIQWDYKNIVKHKGRLERLL
jgi:Domain of unknown function (DU1801)